LAAVGSGQKEKHDHRHEPREELIAELETIERRLTEQTDKLRDTTLQLASAEQRERDTLAQILHDDLQPLLLAAKWNLSSLKKQIRTNRPLSRELSLAIRMIERSIDMSRSLSRDLSPPLLDCGLLPAVARLVESFQEVYGFRVVLRADPNISDIPDSLKDFLFQAIRELLMNAAKHSNQTEAHLRLTECRGTIEVEVCDEGVGFDPKALDRVLAKGSGLLRIWTRTVRLGGQLNLETIPGSGTTFRLSVPCGPIE